ncbi:hypothetical protein [Lewinella sp. LCG006]|uniref:DUF2541 family protein n=1 Tax=Lewinella sp. LCG006 TaxID=3231911 RepID=UPI003460BECD
MKSYFSSSLLIICAFFFLNKISAHSVSSDAVLENPPRWEKLGQRRVNYGLDRDEILVTAREGTFTALRLHAELAPMNFHRCVVHFANGSTQTFQISETVRAGQTTRLLDLTGNNRIITKVVFWYDTKNRANRRGRVELWGRH